MKTLSHTELADVVRDCADAVEYRFWIAVPYIGGWTSVECIIGNKWRKNEQIDVRLLTDIEEKSAFAGETLRVFRDRAIVKHILGLHAKIYIFDEKAIITSANLTRAAFTQRHEVGILLQGAESNEIIKIFTDWWNSAADIEENQWMFQKSENPVCRDEQVHSNLKSHTKLRPALKAMEVSVETAENHGLTIFNLVVQEYGYFAKEYLRYFQYLGLDRLWPDVLVNLETDRFMNFLFHETASGQPSKPFSKRGSKPNQFNTIEERFEFIQQEIQKFMEFVKIWPNYINDEIDQMTTVKQLLNSETVDRLGRRELTTILKQINAITSDRRLTEYKINEITKAERLENIREGLKTLLTEADLPISQKMANIKALKVGIGNSVICEIVANLYPEKYPKINANSLAGLRYLGYDVPRNL